MKNQHKNCQLTAVGMQWNTDTKIFEGQGMRRRCPHGTPLPSWHTTATLIGTTAGGSLRFFDKPLPFPIFLASRPTRKEQPQVERTTAVSLAQA